jgi:tetratricopeptide (TPR) repeat protein
MSTQKSEQSLASVSDKASHTGLSSEDLAALLGDLNVAPDSMQAVLERLSSIINVQGDSNVTFGNDVINSVIAIGKDITIGAREKRRTTPVRELRKPVADFVGRSQLIDAIAGDLTGKGEGNSSGYIIRGMGGVGKTELALKVAQILSEHFPDAQLFLNLQLSDGTAQQPSELLKQYIRKFIEYDSDLPDGLHELSAAYRDCLAGKRALILLDNAHSKEQVFPLLPPAGCVLLVTTRETFAVPGVKTVSLESLKPEEARALLFSICHRIGDGLADQIGFLCGYLPLAIRAAGSLLYVEENLDPAEYARQLHDERTRLESLGSEGDGLEVEASFNLSYRRLSPESARVFRQLSVFPASFEELAETAICQDADHKSLNDLRKHSLVLYEGKTRRYRLHNLIRLFATKLITPEEQHQAALLHARHYAAIFHVHEQPDVAQHEEIDGDHAPLEVLEWDNLKAGHQWATSQFTSSPEDEEMARLCLKYALEARTHFRPLFPPREKIRLVESALSAARTLKRPKDEVLLLEYMAGAYASLHEHRRSVDARLGALKLCRSLEERELEGHLMLGLGIDYSELGNTSQAIEYLEQALPLFEQAENRVAVASVLRALGIAYVIVGENARAIELCEKSIEITNRLEDSFDKGRTVGELAHFFKAIEEYARALNLYEESLRIFRRIGSLHGEASTLGNIGILHTLTGEHDKALEFYDQALLMMRKIGDHLNQIVVLNNMGTLYARQDDYARSMMILHQALDISRQAGARRSEAEILDKLASGFYLQDKLPEAISCFEKALTLSESLDKQQISSFLERLSRYCNDAGDKHKALFYARQEAQQDPEKAEAHLRVAILLREQGEAHEAEKEAREAVRLDPGSGNSQILLFGLLAEAERVEEALGVARQAGEHLTSAADLNTIAGVLTEAGLFVEAERLYRQAIQREPEQPEAHHGLGVLLSAHMQKHADAIGEHREAIRSDPDNFKYHFFLSNALGGAGQWKESEEAIRVAIRLNPDFGPAYTLLGTALEVLGHDDSEIEQQYRQAIRLGGEIKVSHTIFWAEPWSGKVRWRRAPPSFGRPFDVSLIWQTHTIFWGAGSTIRNNMPGRKLNTARRSVATRTMRGRTTTSDSC